jgi:hypothetical protein
LLIKTIARMELHAACARVTVSQNDGAIAAIATVILKAPDRSAIERDQAWLWVYGYFVYETVMRSVKPRGIGFAAHWEGDMNPNLLRIPIGFVMNGPPAYVYQRERET